MTPKPTPSWRLLTHCGAAMTALGLLTLTAPTIANSAPVVPFDEPPCYMRTQDGRVVNLESLCRRSPIAPSQSPATNQQPAVPPKTSVPQATPNQVRLPASLPNTAGSHAQGNPDSDDGRY